MVNITEIFTKIKNCLNPDCISEDLCIEELGEQAKVKKFTLRCNNRENIFRVKLSEPPVFFCKRSNCDGLYVIVTERKPNTIYLVFVELKTSIKPDNYYPAKLQLLYSILSFCGNFVFSDPSNYKIITMLVGRKTFRDANSFAQMKRLKQEQYAGYRILLHKIIKNGIEEGWIMVEREFDLPFAKVLKQIVVFCDDESGEASFNFDDIVKILN